MGIKNWVEKSGGDVRFCYVLSMNRFYFDLRKENILKEVRDVLSELDPRCFDFLEFDKHFLRILDMNWKEETDVKYNKDNESYEDSYGNMSGYEYYCKNAPYIVIVLYSYYGGNFYDWGYGQRDREYTECPELAEYREHMNSDWRSIIGGHLGGDTGCRDRKGELIEVGDLVFEYNVNKLHRVDIGLNGEVVAIEMMTDDDLYLTGICSDCIIVKKWDEIGQVKNARVDEESCEKIRAGI